MQTKTDFEQWYSKEDPWRFNNSIADQIRRTILLKQIEVIFSDGSKKYVLDAGCGEGYITRDVATTYNVEIDAFDISDNALIIARVKNAHDRINYFQLNLNDFIPDKTYDLVMCEEMLYYIKDDEQAPSVRKFHQAINEGGYINITVIVAGETRWGKYPTTDSIKELLVSNGFELISVLPSVIQKKGFVEKAFYKLLGYLNKVKLVSPSLLRYLTEKTLHRPLDRCYSVSLLAKKV